MKLPAWLRLVHWVILANLGLQVIYGLVMVFFVVTGGQGAGPLFGAAGELPFETMVTRRLYAGETWIAIVGLSLYVAVTEILPRRLRL
jgi:hypothetical protein